MDERRIWILIIHWFVALLGSDISRYYLSPNIPNSLELQIQDSRSINLHVTDGFCRIGHMG